MNEAYLPSMADGARPARRRRRRDRRRDRHLGQEDLLRRRRPGRLMPVTARTTPAAVFATRPGSRPSCAGWRRSAGRSSPRVNGTALGGGLEIALACHHRIALDAPGVDDRAARGHPRPAARCRRRRPHGPPAGHRDGADRGPAAGAAAPPGPARWRSAWSTSWPPAGRAAGPGPRRGSPANPDAAPAVGHQGLPDPRRHAGDAVVRRHAARVPGHPAQAAQGRALSGPAPHPGRRGRGHPGRPRHRAAHRGPLLRRSGHRARSPRT